MAVEKKRTTYGNGTTYQDGNRYISQQYYTVVIDGRSYTRRISGTGTTETKAIRKRNKNTESWEKKLRNKLAEKEALTEDRVDDLKNMLQPEDWHTKVTLNQVFYMNLKRIQTSAQVSTSDNYETYYKGYIEKHPLGEMPIESITEEQLLDFYAEMKRTGRKRIPKGKDGEPLNVKPLSITTINHIRFVVANTFRYAFEKHLIQSNPHAVIRPFKAGTAAMLDFDQEDLDSDSDDADALQRVIPMEDVKQFLAYAYTHSRLAGLFAWAVNSGMRQGECLGLKRTCASVDSDYVLVKRSLAFVKNRNPEITATTVPILKKPKNGKERKVPYNENLREIYERQMIQIERDKKEAGGYYVDRGLLFADGYGDYLRPWKVLKEFQRLLQEVGITQHRFHDLRHTFVSLLVKESQRRGEGVSVLDVCAIVGHSDPTVTLKIYGGLFPDSSKTAMKILDDCQAIKLPA